MANPVLSEILRQGRGKPRKHVLAAIETGIVESGLKNLPGGDADSAGWRQERASLYPNPTNVKASVRRFYREAAQHDQQGLSAGELAANVQRPAAQYRGRYGQVQGRAQKLLSGVDMGAAGEAGTGPAFKPWRVQTGSETSFDQAGFEDAQRKSIVGNLIAKRRGTDSILFRSGLLSTQAPNEADFTDTRQTSRIVPGRLGGAGGGSAAAAQGQAGTVLREAAKRVGVSEVNGSNRGGKLDKWQSKFGMVGQPWCGIFVGISLRAAGIKVDSSIASVAGTIAQARAGRGPFKAYLRPEKARSGDVFTIGSGTHMGLIEKVNRNRTVQTIEGNTGNGRVERKTRNLSEFSGVARPRYR